MFLLLIRTLSVLWIVSVAIFFTTDYTGYTEKNTDFISVNDKDFLYILHRVS
jgi:hypothetical protein